MHSLFLPPSLLPPSLSLPPSLPPMTLSSGAVAPEQLCEADTESVRNDVNKAPASNKLNKLLYL